MLSYCMVCAYLREDNPRVLESGLFPVQTHKPYNNFLIAPACIRTSIHVHFIQCEIFDENIGLSLKGAIKIKLFIKFLV